MILYDDNICWDGSSARERLISWGKDDDDDDDGDCETNYANESFAERRVSLANRDVNNGINGVDDVESDGSADNKNVSYDNNAEIEWLYIPIAAICSVLLESTVDDTFNDSKGINSVVAAVFVYVGEAFGSWSCVFCFSDLDDEKKDVIVLVFHWFDGINLFRIL